MFFISFQIIDLFIISTLSFFHLYFSYFNTITINDISLTAGSGRCLCKTPKNKELTFMLLAHQKAITNNSQLSYLTNYTVSNLVEVNRCDLFFYPKAVTHLSANCSIIRLKQMLNLDLALTLRSVVSYTRYKSLYTIESYRFRINEGHCTVSYCWLCKYR